MRGPHKLYEIYLIWFGWIDWGPNLFCFEPVRHGFRFMLRARIFKTVYEYEP
uniref:Uncharacterized protein n=1 Tax=Vitis vinifera TaxID=29760 RepID=F6GXF6_VITVI